MKTMMLVAGLGVALMAAGCEGAPPHVPRRVRARMGIIPTIGGGVGTCEAWRLECIEPLALSPAADGRLVCHQREGGF